MEKYYVQVNGLWVTHCWDNIGRLSFSTNRDEVEHTLNQTQIKWVKELFGDNVKVFKLVLEEVLK
ncbi:hypothetical protein V7128_05625 [Neobacillus vireti]|uniref:hypothetical protein n=1 Tax=Neobacillus vireti TaxID=220686 RepID=UPI002FFD755D